MNGIEWIASAKPRDVAHRLIGKSRPDILAVWGAPQAEYGKPGYVRPAPTCPAGQTFSGRALAAMKPGVVYSAAEVAGLAGIDSRTAGRVLAWMLNQYPHLLRSSVILNPSSRCRNGRSSMTGFERLA